jgi:pyridoxal phosphate enzyme (YggS family)
MSPEPSDYAFSRNGILRRITAAGAAGDPSEHLLAVSKMQPAQAVRTLAATGQRRFGENYVQEAIAKQAALADLPLEWHLIGPLQSNKCTLAAGHFDWIHSIDRPKLVALLARARDAMSSPLNLLLQVNIDDEDSKSGCKPEAVDALAALVEEHPALRLRGLMAIPAPFPDMQRRRDAFERMRALFETLREKHPQVDTLSMGMSEDFELAIRSGATLVRVGTALFGKRR